MIREPEQKFIFSNRSLIFWKNGKAYSGSTA